jgi:hypothetical protein
MSCVSSLCQLTACETNVVLQAYETNVHLVVRVVNVPVERNTEDLTEL